MHHIIKYVFNIVVAFAVVVWKISFLKSYQWYIFLKQGFKREFLVGPSKTIVCVD